MKLILSVFLALLFTTQGWAACPSLSIKDGAGASTPMSVTADASGNCQYNIKVGGFESGTAPVQTATPANASHAAGTSVGGLFTIPVARFAGGSGVISNFTWISTGGATTQFLVRLWDKNPASTTCTDNSAFAGNATDNTHLISIPFNITPVPPAVTTGDANTYATVTGMSLNYKNQDTSPSVNVYACVTTVATDTADQNKAVYINLMGPQD